MRPNGLLASLPVRRILIAHTTTPSLMSNASRFASARELLLFKSGPGIVAQSTARACRFLASPPWSVPWFPSPLPVHAGFTDPAAGRALTATRASPFSARATGHTTASARATAPGGEGQCLAPILAFCPCLASKRRTVLKCCNGQLIALRARIFCFGLTPDYCSLVHVPLLAQVVQVTLSNELSATVARHESLQAAHAELSDEKQGVEAAYEVCPWGTMLTTSEYN